MFPPRGSKDVHGNELQIGTNCLGPHLLYRLLEPILVKTAASSPKGTVRVTWAGSSAIDVVSPRPDGVELADDGRPKDRGVLLNYGQSKVGNLFLAREFARSTPRTGITHACFNPGNLKTELQRHWQGRALNLLVSQSPDLFAAASVTDSVRKRTSCCFIRPSTARTPSSGSPSHRT